MLLSFYIFQEGSHPCPPPFHSGHLRLYIAYFLGRSVVARGQSSGEGDENFLGDGGILHLDGTGCYMGLLNVFSKTHWTVVIKMGEMCCM